MMSTNAKVLLSLAIFIVAVSAWSANAQVPTPAAPPNLSSPIQHPPPASGNVVISKDDLAVAQIILQIGGGLFATLALVFGAIVGVNVFNGSAILKDARVELNSAKEELLALRKAKLDYENGIGGLKVELDKITQDAVEKVRKEAHQSFEVASKRLYRKSTLDDYIKDIHAELLKSKPDEAILFPKVTALVGYFDDEIVTVYRECFAKLPPNSDTVLEILKNGFKSLHIQNVPQPSA
jgi:hypothetical protein